MACRGTSLIRKRPTGDDVERGSLSGPGRCRGCGQRALCEVLSRLLNPPRSMQQLAPSVPARRERAAALQLPSEERTTLNTYLKAKTLNLALTVFEPSARSSRASLKPPCDQCSSSRSMHEFPLCRHEESKMLRCRFRARRQPL